MPELRYDLATLWEKEPLLSARLLVVQGIDQGRRFEVGKPVVRIGRGVQSDVRILDTEASRRHAVLKHVEGRWFIADEGSSNGTFVNGQAVSEQPLHSGDQIQVGRTILLFTDAQSDSASIFHHVALTSDPEDASQIIGSVEFNAARTLEQRAAAGAASLTPRDANLDVLYQISEEVVRPSMSLDQLLKRILDLTLEGVDADRGVMFVFDSRTDQIEPRVVSVREGMSVSDHLPVSRTIVEYVIAHAHGVQTSDARHDERFEDGQSIVQAGIREAMCVPIQGRYEMLGAIYVDTTSSPARLARLGSGKRFSKELLTLLVAIGRQSALAVENNRYQEALVSAERLAAVGQTIAMLGHDIKNILQAMRGGSYLIDLGLQKHDETLVHKGWGVVERNQDRIFNLVTDMLSFSKERAPKLKTADVNDTVREVCELLQQRAEEQQVELTFRPGAGHPRAQFDPDAIHRAVLNILTNALDALEEGQDGRIEIGTFYDADEERLVIEISDNGPGIPPAELPQLFNLFQSHKGARGTGLGLPVARKVLREHGGDVEVESAPGEGARFRLWWPLHDDEAEGSSISQTSAAGS